MEDSLRLELVEEHGDLIIACYEKLFPGELNRFDDRYCGRVYDVREWAQDCLENAYDGFDEEDIPSLDAWLEFEFFDHYSHDKDLCVGFSNR